MTARWPFVLLATGCVSHIDPVGGTPGPPALACAEADATCRGVARALDNRRRNIGGWCGTPNLRAQLSLLEAGEAAVPYLVRAFDDRDLEVALLAMTAATQLGATGEVIDWCREVVDRTRIELCRDALD